MSLRRLRAPQEAFGQLASRALAERGAGRTNIGQRSEASIRGYTHPGAACLQVATGYDLRRVVPMPQWQTR